MKVSVIIPAYNEAKLIAACVRGVRAAVGAMHAARPDAPAECRVVVVDNNSRDGTGEIAREAGADQVVFEPINQIARARNAGAVAALGHAGTGPEHWLVFVDADSRVGPELLADVIDVAARGGTVGGGAVARFDPPDTALRFAEPVMQWVMRAFRMTAGAFVFCRADAFVAIGGFDTTLFAAEDAKLGADLKRWGRQRGLRLVILHRHPVITSARKTALYRPHEWGTLILRALFTPGTLHDRRRLGFFYDGKR